MNPLLLEDTCVLIFNLLDENVLKLETLSRFHHFLIRRTPWFFHIKVKNFDTILPYRFKNLSVSSSIDVNLYLNYLKNCHTLNLYMTNITDDERALIGKWFEAGAK